MLFDPVLPDGTVVVHPTPRSWYAFAALAVGFCAGRWLDGIPSTVWFSLAAVCGAAALLARGWLCRTILFAAVASLSSGWFVARLLEPAHDSIVLQLPGSGQSIIRFEGTVLDSPRRVERDADPMAPPFHEEGWKLKISIAAVERDGIMTPASGRVWMRLPGSHSAVPATAGDRVLIDGLFSPIEPPLNPGELDRRLWAAQEGYCGFVRAGELRVLNDSRGIVDTIQRPLRSARAWCADRAHTLLLGDQTNESDRQGRALLAALILGDEEPALRESRSAFNRLGLTHVLSISGFHLAILAAVVLFALRVFGDLGWLEPVLVSLLVLAYLAILPFNAPVWRSGLMVLGLLAADAAGRRYDRLAILGWIAVVLLIWRPMDLWSMGFQLSFGLVAVLLWLGGPAHDRLFGRPLRGTIPKPARWWARPVAQVKKGASTNLLCCAAAIPVVMYHTGLVSTLAVVSGLIVVPIITLLLIAAYAAIGVGIVIPGAARIAAPVLAAVAGWTTHLVQWIDEAPWSSVRVPTVSVFWAALATGVILYWFARGYVRDSRAWAATVAIAMLGAVQMWLGAGLSRGVAVRIDTLAVGDGTCHIVRSGNEAMMWDCGSLTPGVGRMLVPQAARELGAWDVPTVVITHPNLDHFNGVLDIAEPLSVRRVLVGEEFARHARAHPRSPEAYLLTELARRGVEVRIVTAGERITLGEATVDFLSPPKGATWPEDNDHSLVAKITAPGVPAILLCGDIQAPAMEWIRIQHPDLHAAIMEAPHHGSARDAAFAFVGDVNPSLVLQSTGPSRAGDERWADVRAARAWWCTANNGAVWTEVRRDGRIRSGPMR